jgi:predicted small secreted protein
MNINRKSIAAIAGVCLVAASLTACEEAQGTAQGDGQKQTETAFAQQSSAVPYPISELKDSLERRNLKERLIRTNKPNAQGYVYLMSFGTIIGYYTVKGKVSSTQSQMTTDNLVIDRTEGDVVVNAPGDDGSYGANEDGIFFFTTEGQMVTTNLDYIWSDKPLAVDVPRLDK